MNIKIKAIDYHRNGVSGCGFNVVLFRSRDDGGKWRNMVATVFPERGCVAVLDVDETAAGNIEFANGNSWRGDHFEDLLRDAIAQHDAEENRVFEGLAATRGLFEVMAIPYWRQAAQ